MLLEHQLKGWREEQLLKSMWVADGTDNLLIIRLLQLLMVPGMFHLNM